MRNNFIHYGKLPYDKTRYARRLVSSLPWGIQLQLSHRRFDSVEVVGIGHVTTGSGNALSLPALLKSNLGDYIEVVFPIEYPKCDFSG